MEKIKNRKIQKNKLQKTKFKKIKFKNNKFQMEKLAMRIGCTNSVPIQQSDNQGFGRHGESFDSRTVEQHNYDHADMARHVRTKLIDKRLREFRQENRMVNRVDSLFEHFEHSEDFEQLRRLGHIRHIRHLRLLVKAVKAKGLRDGGHLRPGLAWHAISVQKADLQLFRQENRRNRRGYRLFEDSEDLENFENSEQLGWLGGLGKIYYICR